MVVQMPWRRWAAWSYMAQARRWATRRRRARWRLRTADGVRRRSGGARVGARDRRTHVEMDESDEIRVLVARLRGRGRRDRTGRVRVPHGQHQRRNDRQEHHRTDRQDEGQSKEQAEPDQQDERGRQPQFLFRERQPTRTARVRARCVRLGRLGLAHQPLSALHGES